MISFKSTLLRTAEAKAGVIHFENEVTPVPMHSPCNHWRVKHVDALHVLAQEPPKQSKIKMKNCPTA
jgi:hypothetical protein